MTKDRQVQRPRASAGAATGCGTALTGPAGGPGYSAVLRASLASLPATSSAVYSLSRL